VIEWGVDDPPLMLCVAVDPKPGQWPDDATGFQGTTRCRSGGGIKVGESYSAAAAHELAEEIGVTVPVQFMFTYLCRGVIAPYWLWCPRGVDQRENLVCAAGDRINDWMTEVELQRAVRRWRFVPDGQNALRRYFAVMATGAG
jgi:8-oxo-dGTP pyrophosphatase MutT (NUDIX family)